MKRCTCFNPLFLSPLFLFEKKSGEINRMLREKRGLKKKKKENWGKSESHKKVLLFSSFSSSSSEMPNSKPFFVRTSCRSTRRRCRIPEYLLMRLRNSFPFDFIVSVLSLSLLFLLVAIFKGGFTSLPLSSRFLWQITLRTKKLLFPLFSPV